VIDARVVDWQVGWVRGRGKRIAPSRILESALWVGRCVEVRGKLVNIGDKTSVFAPFVNPTILAGKLAAQQAFDEGTRRQALQIPLECGMCFADGGIGVGVDVPDPPQR
jgi:hypothetical protein